MSLYELIESIDALLIDAREIISTIAPVIVAPALPFWE